jgi:hypothetical protein
MAVLLSLSAMSCLAEARVLLGEISWDTTWLIGFQLLGWQPEPDALYPTGKRDDSDLSSE